MDENEVSKAIYQCAIEVHRTLGGPGLLESVYEEALACELADQGHVVERQVQVPVRYKQRVLATPRLLLPAEFANEHEAEFIARNRNWTGWRTRSTGMGCGGRLCSIRERCSTAGADWRRVAARASSRGLRNGTAPALRWNGW